MRRMRIAIAVANAIGLVIVGYFAWHGGFRNEWPASMFEGVPEVVTLQVAEQPQRSAQSAWFAVTYAQETASTKFAIELQKFDHQPTEDNPFTVTRGVLHRTVGSQQAPLLKALAHLHQVPAPAGAGIQLESLPIEVGVLAVGAAVNTADWNIAGRYSTNERGNWLVMKLFIPIAPGAKGSSDEDNCEVFLSINRVEGIAEFSVKDSDYGVPLLAALAQIL
jgi:hypothetical protein